MRTIPVGAARGVKCPSIIRFQPLPKQGFPQGATEISLGKRHSVDLASTLCSLGFRADEDDVPSIWPWLRGWLSWPSH